MRTVVKDGYRVFLASFSSWVSGVSIAEAVPRKTAAIADKASAYRSLAEARNEEFGLYVMFAVTFTEQTCADGRLADCTLILTVY